MKKVFISLPITGCEEWAREEAARVKEVLTRQGYDVITPFEVAPVPNQPIGYYIGKCVEALLGCDAVCRNPQWKHSKGCRLERAAARVYGIKRIKYPVI